MIIDQVRSNFEEPNSFVGRQRELDELCRFVPSIRALTLCGSGGIGKTRLALRVLAGLANDFPDGVWFIELADLRQPDLVASRVAAVIGVEEEPGRPMLETLADALRPRRLLLALDNCEHLIDSCARLCQRLLASSQGLRVLATSREPLRVAAETVWQVPPLSLPRSDGAEVEVPDELGQYEAIRLFCDRAEASHPGFARGPANLPAIAALCRALDGVPLAIELAAAWVRVLTVEQIVARLDDRFRLLTSGDRTAPPRQRTLRAAIDWSYDLLGSREQLLLRRLSVFAGWSLEMAEQLCSGDDLPAHDVLDLLATLADKSLVVVDAETRGQARYRMLDTIREYAASRLAEAGETVMMQQRLRDYSIGETEHLSRMGMALIEAPWSARVEAFRRFDADVANLRQVLSWCLAEGDAESGMRICTAMRPVWIVRGAFAEGAEWLDSFLTLGGTSVRAAVRGPALVGRAQLALANDPVGAQARALEGLELCREAGQDSWTAAALNLLTEAALHAGDTDEAAAHADSALAVARKAGDRWNEGYALGTKAAVAALRGDLPEAQRLAESALEIMRDIDQQWGAARALMGLADLARLRRDPGGAQLRYEQALVILREVNARPEIARCLAGLGRIAMDQGDVALGRQHLTESIRMSRFTGGRIGVIRGLEAFATLAIREQRPDRAVQLAAAASALREQAHLPSLSGTRTERYLTAARGLGQETITQLWEQGSALDASAAVDLALTMPDVAGPGEVPGPRSRPGTRPSEPGGKAPAPGGLTPRELEIVALIAEGHSNRAIGEKLVISPATAARHVANILLKLGFSSRAQVAAWATRESRNGGPPAG